MLVYIFGGERTDYLELQVDMIRKHVPDLTEIRYLQGPLHGNREVSSASAFTESLPEGVVDVRVSDHEVRPAIKPVRLRNLIEHCLLHYDDSRSLFLHGDCLPFDTVDAEKILNGHQSAGCRAFSRQWFLTEGYEGRQDTQIYSVQSFTKRQWEVSVGDIPLQLMQLYFPVFFHFDNYSMDNQETIDLKVQAYGQLLR